MVLFEGQVYALTSFHFCEWQALAHWYPPLARVGLQVPVPTASVSQIVCMCACRPTAHAAWLQIGLVPVVGRGPQVGDPWPKE